MHIRTNIITPLSKTETLYRKDVVITIKDGLIKSITDSYEFDFTNSTVANKLHLITIPGLIDTHVHLSQWRIRGKYKNDLLEWLNTYTFKEELKSFQSAYAKEVSEDFFANLIKNGTTTALIYVSISKEATDIAFEEADRRGIRALIGKVNMDINSPDYLMEDSTKSLEESIELCEKWDNKRNLNFVFTPRFAPVCSEKLMRGIGDYAQKHSKYIQTHLSENKNEIAMVKEMYPQYKSYTDVYAECNLLGKKSIMAHCIHLTDSEIELIKKTDTKISHCPDSNFFLKSGALPYEKYKNAGLPVSLASDVAGGTTLDMFYQMKMANYIQFNYSLEVEELFYLGTLAGAEALSKEGEIGSLEEGKCADMVMVEVADFEEKSSNEILSELIYVRGSSSVMEVYVNGRKINEVGGTNAN